ncbi:MAG: InlB B-repeat-containing protein [Clostridia bacterium]|nr:InlB B-repeat-containing protein [Clostridia bacterium]
MVLALLPTIAAAETTDVTDVLTAASLEATSTTYTNFSGVTFNSDAVYAGNSAKTSSGGIQLRSKNSNSGIVTTVSGGKVKSVSIVVESGSNTLDVYGSNTAYTSAADLYNTASQGTKLGSLNADGTVLANSDYAYIGLRSNSGAIYLTSISIEWEVDGDTPQPTTYTVSFDANGGTGTMADVTTTSPYTLPACTFTAPDGKEFDYWAVDGDEGMYAPGASYALTGDTTFVAQWKDLPVVTYTDMMLKRVPANGDVVVIYYPTAGKVMTGADYLYNNKKHELVAADATLTDDVLAVPSDALRLTVTTTVADDGETTLYTFATADGKYLEADGTNVQLVSSQGANTLFQLETAAAGTDNWYIKCDSATYNGNAQYIEYYGGYFTVYGMGTNTAIFTFQFFSEDGEGPTPPVTYIVTLDPGEAGGEQVTIEDATSPYTLPDCPFTAPEGMVFDGWTMAGGDGDVYPAGAQVTLEEPNVTFIAQWKELVARTYELVTSDEELVDGETYLIASELFVDELYLMSKQTSNNRAQYKLSNVEGTTITLDESWIATSESDELAFEFTLVDAEDGWAFYDEVTGGYLYAASSSSNWLRTETELDDNGKFAIDLGEDGATVPVALGENTRNYMHYNGENNIFSCYAETSHIEAAVYLYKLVEEEPVELSDGFYLIGPDWTVNAIDPTEKFGENMEAGGELILAATLAEGDEIKVVKVENNAITAWYPDGLDNQYTVDAAHAGDVNIYFREEYYSAWSEFGGYFYIEAGYDITCVSAEHGLVSTSHSRAAAGTTVTIYLEAEEGYVVDTLTVMCGETEVETTKVNDEQYTFVMPAGDVTITATFAIPATEPFFKSQNLILDGLIGVSFNMELPEIAGVDYDDSYMTFSVEHGACTERVDYTASKTKNSGTQAFVCYVSAVMMAEPITATFHYTQNGTELTVEKTYAITDYIEAYDENPSQFDDTTQALIESLADYGHYVQAMLAVQKGWTLGNGEDADYKLMNKCYQTSYNIDTITSAVEDKGITCENDGAAMKKLNFTVVFDSATTLRLLVKLTSGYSGDFTAALDGGDPYAPTPTGGWYHVDVENVAAHELSHTCEIVLATDGGSATITLSALSYVKLMIGNADSTIRNAMAAFYSYSAAADAFKAAH